MARKKEKREDAGTQANATSFWVERRSDIIVAILLAVACVAIFYQVAKFDFVGLDDDVYVYENPIVATGLTSNNIAAAFTSFQADNWHPITWISHQLDVTLFGVNPGAHHVVNLVFHIANSILLYFLISGITGSRWKSAVVAVIFAVHPAHVESVAWIAERKDVLSTLFWILASFAYVRYARDGANKRAYWLAVVLFAIGLMAKPMLVTFPFALLLLDYWPLKRLSEFRWDSIRPLVVEKIPFFALSVASAVITVIAQRAHGAVQSLETFTMTERIANAVVSYAKYVAMLFYPANLAVWYPFERDLSVPQVIGSAIFLIAVSAISIWQIRKRPYLFVGWFWFVGTLVPVIGLVQVGRQALADRYTYIPYIGLSLAVVWLIGELLQVFRAPFIAQRVAAVVCLLALAAFAFGHVPVWKNSETLFTQALDVTKNNYLIEANFCRYLETANRIDDAFRHCTAAIQIDPRGVVALNTLGSVQLKQGKAEEARNTFQQVTEIDPNYSLAYANQSIAAGRLGNLEVALAKFQLAVSHDQGGFFDAGRRAEAYSSIGSSAFAAKRYDLAGRAFELALEATPNNAEYQRSLAMAYRSAGRSGEAVKLLQGIIEKYPNIPETYNTLGIIYAEQNRMPEAVAQFQKALQINPGFTPAQTNLRRALDSK